ncbi:MAG: hypothetical protein ABEJ56_04575 [Candidatus Nanohaloarchaea archaeon]
METRLASVRENPLLGRRHVEVEMEHEGEATPSEEDVKKRLAAENDLDVEKIEVESIKTGFGSNTSTGILKIYEEFEYPEEFAENTVEKEEEENVEEERETEAETDYQEVVSGTISDAKDELEAMETPDFEAALEAERDNKNRTTFVDWLESKAGE